MFKNQLQELAQRSCFNLPSYACIREGPDHAPRFKASVNFNGEIFESPNYSATLRQAEYAAAQVAVNALSSSGPSRSLIAKVLDETGVYKNLLQETAHRAGLKLPVYTTVRSGPGHLPVFTSTVELAGSRRRLLMRNPATEQQHLMRIVDLICMNSSIEASSSSSTPKQNNCCFVSLLPPPPPRTTSRILPPTPPNFPWPVHLSNSKSEPTTITCSTTTVEMLDEHLRRREEGNEWLDGGGPPSKSSNSSVIPKTDPAFFHSRSIAVTSCTGNLISTSSSEGGRYHHSDSHSYSRIRNRIAPAVHIRSVIPVCAAAPAPPLPPASI